MKLLYILAFGFTLVSAHANSDLKRPSIASSGIYANSDILTSGNYHTVVPKGAVLAVPTNLGSKVASKPSGDFLIWPQFLLKNHYWLMKKEVTYEQASGEKTINKLQMDMLKRSGKVVIAVMRNNPTSVAVHQDLKNSEL